MKTEGNNLTNSLNSNLTTTLPANASIGPYPYHNFHKLGESEGYMSEVYLASTFTEQRSMASRPARSSRDLGQPDAHIVIKIARVMDKKQGKYNADALLKENYWLQQLNHPAIVQILPIRQAYGNSAAYSAQSNLAGAPWFTVLEYLQGGTLARLLRTDQQSSHTKPQRLELIMVLRTIYLLASALDYLHQQGIAHLDIKPSNILFRFPLLTGQPVDPVLIDFGLVGNIGQDKVKAHTQAYSAPERLCGNAPYATAAMDIYSLGIVFYEMLVGMHPFVEQSSSATVAAMQSGRQPPPPSSHNGITYMGSVIPTHISGRLDALVLRMLTYAPESRPSARGVCKELKLLLVELGADIFAQPDSPPTPLKKCSWSLPLASSLLTTIWILTALFLILVYPDWFAQERAATAPAQIAEEAISPLPAELTLQPTGIPTLSALPAFSTARLTQSPTPTSLMPTLSTSNGSNWEHAISVTLNEPKEGDAGKNKIRFSWVTSRAPGYNQAFEIVFWPEGGNPLGECKNNECFVVESDIQSQEFDREIDLSLIVTNGKMPADLQYSWGVRIVNLYDAHRPMYLLGNQQHTFHLES